LLNSDNILLLTSIAVFLSSLLSLLNPPGNSQEAATIKNLFGAIDGGLGRRRIAIRPFNGNKHHCAAGIDQSKHSHAIGISAGTDLKSLTEPGMEWMRGRDPSRRFVE
jgi:hypothetical protein